VPGSPGRAVRDGYVSGMALEVGIVGLPKSGKTTLFNALTHAGAHVHEAKPHVGMASIADERLTRLAPVERAAKVTPATIRVQDVPGTGPALLGNLRKVDALLGVVSGFASGADPAGDLETLKLELLVADRDHVEKRLERARQQAKSGDAKLKHEVTGLEALLAHVEAGGTIADYDGEISEALEPLTTKPLVVVENGPTGIDLQLEAELAELSDEEAAAFRDGPSALEEVVARLTEALGLIAFFTIGPTEARAWTLRSGRTALEAAADIHTDIARGFIRCEVIPWQDLVDAGSRAEVRKRGIERLEGKDYVVRDGDVLNIRFNV
jgi:ribosome-binding ATPase YchF (GTP1/OBG family)